MPELQWYDPNLTLSHNCFINMILGNRNIGKSYGWNKKTILDFKKEPHWQCAYVRRHEEDLKIVMPTYYSAVRKEFPADELTTKGNYMFVNGEVAGIAIPLSKAQSFKSSAFPFIKYIIFDEVLIDGGKTTYLKGEVHLLESLINTIFRDRIITDPANCKVILLSNNVSFMNPYFVEWKMQVDSNKRFQKYKENTILLQLENNESIADALANSPYGKLIADSSYGDYALHNKSLIDRDTFIEERPKNSRARYSFTFIYKDFTIGVWTDIQEGKMYVTEKVDPYCKIVYSFTAQDHKPNTILLHNLNKSYWLKMFVDCFNSGAMRFETQNIKNIVYEVLKMTV
jgi:hypothetical protein